MIFWSHGYIPPCPSFSRKYDTSAIAISLLVIYAFEVYPPVNQQFNPAIEVGQFVSTKNGWFSGSFQLFCGLEEEPWLFAVGSQMASVSSWRPDCFTIYPLVVYHQWPYKYYNILYTICNIYIYVTIYIWYITVYNMSLYIYTYNIVIYYNIL